ncbi:hypothetical protein COLO4_14681 [Corchorus olitorius]|uniref:peptidylprolyl isomerase n=1 Tax=Corchorus olitorius TaxID=93759 RepID=A0A1R3JR03_9ROSI|nr:hypothetical protein COLO4_14681 [Corchorus olitorius]
MARKEKAVIYVTNQYLTPSPLLPVIEGYEELHFEVELVHFIQVPEGFEMCVRLMLPGEIALVTCPPDYAYDKFSRPPNVPAGAHVQWEIELLGFEMPKDWTGMDFKSIMDEADKIRVTGNRLFKEGKFELAKAKYEKVLDATPVHAKALYRRGMAYMAAGDFEEARSDFQKMIKVDKSSEPDATAALAKLKKQEQEVEKKARKQFKGLFDKKPGEIAEVEVEDRGGDQKTDENEKNTESSSSEGDDEYQDTQDAPADQPRMNWLYNVWPMGGRGA